MNRAPESLVFDLVEWVAKEERPYRDVMETWRTSCPRLTVWEDAMDRGFIERRTRRGQVVIAITAAGRKFLRERAPALH